MADRRSWEYQTVAINGDLAALGKVCVNGWKLHMIVERKPNNCFICLLEREVSLLIS